MRRTSTKKEWFYTDEDKLIGIAMGSDFCSEHEWGVKNMKDMFGCDDTKDGLERRRIRELPEGLVYKETKEYTALAFLPLNYTPRDKQFEGALNYHLAIPWKGNADPNLACAWSESDFGIVAYGDMHGEKKSRERQNVRELYGAFQRKDIAFWPSIGVFHTGGGLILMIASRIPQENQDQLLERDLDSKKLDAAAKATGIAERLKAAGQRWLSLSPRWISEDLKAQSKYPVMFWLNPMDQKWNNSGWFTVEQLDHWTFSIGPVVKSEEQRNKDR